VGNGCLGRPKKAYLAQRNHILVKASCREEKACFLTPAFPQIGKRNTWKKGEKSRLLKGNEGREVKNCYEGGPT